MDGLKLVEKLIIDLGFSVREAKVYTTLFIKNDFTASEIQKLVNIPRTKVYEVLQILISKGMCEEKKTGHFKKFEVLNPVYVFDRLYNDLVRKENVIKNVLDILTPIFEQRKENNKSLDYIEVLKNREEIRRKFLDFVQNAKEEILCFSKRPYASTIEDVISGEGQPLINKKNGRLKVMDICEYSSDFSESEKEDFFLEVSHFINNGEEVRIIDELPMKMLIFDGRITMVALKDPVSLKQGVTTMVNIDHPCFAQSLKCVFESYWEKAMTFEEFMAREKLRDENR